MSKLCRSCKMLQRVMISSRMDGTSYINLHSACVSPSLPADNVSEPAACSVLMSFASVGKSVPDGSMDTDLHGYEYGSEMLDPRITRAIAYLYRLHWPVCRSHPLPYMWYTTLRSLPIQR